VSEHVDGTCLALELWHRRGEPTRRGIHGNATLATPEKGRAVLSAMVDDLMRVIEAMAELSMR
jgi:creatinine amidohydrolase/Fe(II)-dependent formamide hydrolase-like protein